MNKDTAKLVKSLRKELAISQTELGNKVGVSAMAVSRWEAGHATPDGTFLIALAKASPKDEQFWGFLAAAGLSQKDIKRRV